MIAPHTSMLLSYGIGAVCVAGVIMGAVGYVVSPRFRRFLDRQEARGERRRRGE